VNELFSFPENSTQTSEILKSENEAFKTSLQRAFLQNFSSLDFDPDIFNIFSIFFLKNFKKTLKQISEIFKINYANL
jgi:hypothetical protein